MTFPFPTIPPKKAANTYRYWRSNKTNAASPGGYHNQLIVKDASGVQVTITAGMLSQSGTTAFVAATLINGNTATSNTAFHTDTAAAGSFVQIDFGAGNEQNLHTWIYYTQASTNAIWDIEYSSNGSTWTKAFIGLDVSTGAGIHTATW